MSASEEEEEISDEEYGYDDYYKGGECDLDAHDSRSVDLEYFDYECLKVEDVERLLNQSVETLCKSLQVLPSLGKLLLHHSQWDVEKVIHEYRKDAHKLLEACQIKPGLGGRCNIDASTMLSSFLTCPVCVIRNPKECFSALSCCHHFCKDCWALHFQVQVLQGISTGIECMAQDCHIVAPEDFVLALLSRSDIREKYQQFSFTDYVKSHPQLRFCPGPHCNLIVRAPYQRPKRVICSFCKTSFCFQCGNEYHAPAHCDIIKKWLIKCADDSETANYISAHTKDCPRCHICIEKNGGCNHMQCFNCKQDFCWMCLGDWKTHGSEYYECSRYKENPNVVHESVHAKAREALKKYLFYYERWENHAKSLRLEEQTKDRIKQKIEEKVMSNSGTWIDWQYLLDAPSLLAKCRYTLQYTYPCAYYMEPGARKQLFEYQQAQLEAEIENLSWKIERAETTDRGDMENQMDVAEKRRTTLLKDFLPP